MLDAIIDMILTITHAQVVKAFTSRLVCLLMHQVCGDDVVITGMVLGAQGCKCDGRLW